VNFQASPVIGLAFFLSGTGDPPFRRDHGKLLAKHPL
jgi:hypothetical protein